MADEKKTYEVLEEGGVANLVSKIKEKFASRDVATQAADGLMSSGDKAKLDGIAPNATANVGTITGITTSSPLSGSGTSGNVAISHANSGVSAGSKGESDDKALAFGESFKVLSETVNATGHVTALAEREITMPSAVVTSSSDGLMTGADKLKLDGIEPGATANAGTITAITSTAPITGSGASGSVELGHVTSGPSATASTSKGDTTAQTPSFGGTFKVTSETVDKFGHTTGLEEHTVKIPNATASATADGLMSSAQFAKLSNIEDNATANAGTVTSVATGVGLTGGSITTEGTIKANLKSETALTADSTAAAETAGRIYPIVPDKSGKLAVVVPWFDTTYPAATSSADGLMPSSDKSKLDGIADGANNYTHPAYDAATAAMVKVGRDGTGHVVLGGAVTKDDITALGIPAQDTTYSAMTQAEATAGTATTGRLITAKVLGDTIDGKGYTKNAGTVTSVATGAGLAGGPITGNGTLKANLLSETKLTNAAVAATETANRVYPVALDKDGRLAVNVPWTDTNTQSVTGVKGSSESTYRTGNVNITAANIGLGNVNNTSDANKPISTATQTALDGKVSTSLLGVKNGVATLDANGTVPESQLPSYVDDVLEYDKLASFPTTGESGKIYVAMDTNKTYRWSGSAYVEISASIALGTTSSTAYRGDYGNTAYAHATDSGRLTTTTAAGLYKVGVTAQGHVSALTAVTKADITGLGIPAQDTTYSSKAAASGGTDVSLVTTGEKATWNAKTSNTGTVTSVATGVGLTGGTITGSGTLKAKLKSETALTADSAAATETSGRIYPVVPDKSGNLAVVVPWVNTDTNTTYSVTKGNVGSASAGTAIAADDITAWSAGTAPSLTVTSVACDDITAWSAGSVTSVSYADNNLTITQGTAPSLSYTARSVGSASGWSAGTVPSLSYTARSIPNISVTSTSVVTAVAAN